MGRSGSGWGSGRAPNFNPPIPCGMGRIFHVLCVCECDISIHPSRVGWDSFDVRANLDSFAFQSTHPVWDGTIFVVDVLGAVRISIHPSRVGWDGAVIQRAAQLADFNPPIPCGMGHRWMVAIRCHHHFNPPIPCGMGRNQYHRLVHVDIHFNPPIPCGMGPARWPAQLRRTRHFNPPIPCGMGHKQMVINGTTTWISIHPSRVGWDHAVKDDLYRTQDFNPPIPCGMGQQKIYDYIHFLR